MDSFFSKSKILTGNSVHCDTWDTAYCKASETGGKENLTLISQVHFDIWQAKQPRLQVLMMHSPAYRGLSQEPPENKTRPEVLGELREGVSFFTAPHLRTQPTQTLFWSLLIPFWGMLPALLPGFSSHTSQFSASGWAWQWKCWRTGEDPAPLLTQIWEPMLIRFCCCIPDFGTQKKSRCLSKLNFLRVNYP